MNNFKKIFKNKCSVIGMIHLAALPRTPKYEGSIQKIIDKARKECEIYLKHNVDAILVENMNDIPYVQSKHLQPETTAVLSRICCDIRNLVTLNTPCGVQVLACGNKEALAIAQASFFNFIRAEGFVFSHIADEGFTDANAGEILRYRKQIGAEDVLILTDIKKKHSSHAITKDISILETAKAAEFFMSDGLILTGTSTGRPADIKEFHELKTHSNLPLVIGSGITQGNFNHYAMADAVIIGSFFKDKGLWSNDLNEERVKKFMEYIKMHR